MGLGKPARSPDVDQIAAADATTRLLVSTLCMALYATEKKKVACEPFRFSSVHCFTAVTRHSTIQTSNATYTQPKPCSRTYVGLPL